VWRILKHHGIDPAFLHRYYLLFFIDITTREVYYARVTTNPTGAWTAQAARNLFLAHADHYNTHRTTRCNGLINEYRNAA